MKNKSIAGHLSVLFTVIIWATTFISTKVLLSYLRPAEILLIRFIIGLAALFIAFPKRLENTDIKQEMTFAAAGLCGITLYYLFENIALTYTMASNVGVMVSTAPFFTAILTHIFIKDGERLRVNFFIGFAVAMAGILMINLSGSRFEISPKGDILALLAAVVWGFYSVLTKKISGYGYNTILTTRRIFIYGIAFMLPALLMLGFKPDIHSIAEPICLLNIIYLGLGASALCFVTWNFAVNVLGPVRTGAYIYIQPAITIAASVLILKERVTALSLAGALLTAAGLVISEYKGGRAV